MEIRDMLKELELLRDEGKLMAKSVKVLHEVSLLIKTRIASLDKQLYESKDSMQEWLHHSEKCEELADILGQYRNAYAGIQKIIQIKQRQQLYAKVTNELMVEPFSQEDSEQTAYQTFSISKEILEHIAFVGCLSGIF